MRWAGKMEMEARNETNPIPLGNPLMFAGACKKEKKRPHPKAMYDVEGNRLSINLMEGDADYSLIYQGPRDWDKETFLKVKLNHPAHDMVILKDRNPLKGDGIEKIENISTKMYGVRSKWCYRPGQTTMNWRYVGDGAKVGRHVPATPVCSPRTLKNGNRIFQRLLKKLEFWKCLKILHLKVEKRRKEEEAIMRRPVLDGWK